MQLQDIQRRQQEHYLQLCLEKYGASYASELVRRAPKLGKDPDYLMAIECSPPETAQTLRGYLETIRKRKMLKIQIIILLIVLGVPLLGIGSLAFTETELYVSLVGELGPAEKQHNAGLHFFNGKSYDDARSRKAARYFQKAANKGYGPAQYYLGLCYQNGYGVYQDSAKAEMWFKKGAEQGWNERTIKHH